MLEDDLVSIFCIVCIQVYLCQRKTVFPDKEVFDNFDGYFADHVKDEESGKKGAEEWLEETIWQIHESICCKDEMKKKQVFDDGPKKMVSRNAK